MRAVVEDPRHHRRRSGISGCLAARREGAARMGQSAQGGRSRDDVVNAVPESKSGFLWGLFTAFGFAAAVAALILDQALKLWLLFVYGIEEKGAVALAPFFDLVLVW